MITLASFQPQYFDNNGDQSNVEVLRSHLVAIGVDVQITSECEGADFLLIGDSSIAAHSHFETELLGLLPEIKDRFALGKPTLLVGRSWEFYAPLLGLEIESGDRESTFVKLLVAGHEVIGYHNSTLLKPRFAINGSFIGTTLFGPLLAKNPSVLKLVAAGLGFELVGAFFDESQRLANLVRETTTF